MKKINYTYIVNLTDCVDGCDVLNAFAEAKIKANVPINTTEYNACIVNAIETTISIVGDIASAVEGIVNTVVDACEKTKIKSETKKPNIFKRFWNWMTNKK